jgi:hypothetical protein
VSGREQVREVVSLACVIGLGVVLMPVAAVLKRAPRARHLTRAAAQHLINGETDD